jgi:hypothetical protein
MNNTMNSNDIILTINEPVEMRKAHSFCKRIVSVIVLLASIGYIIGTLYLSMNISIVSAGACTEYVNNDSIYNGTASVDVLPLSIHKAICTEFSFSIITFILCVCAICFIAFYFYVERNKADFKDVVFATLFMTGVCEIFAFISASAGFITKERANDANIATWNAVDTRFYKAIDATDELFWYSLFPAFCALVIIVRYSLCKSSMCDDEY